MQASAPTHRPLALAPGVAVSIALPVPRDTRRGSLERGVGREGQEQVERPALPCLAGDGAGWARGYGP